MGVRDLFRRNDDDHEEAAQADSVSSPLDVDGQGPVTLADRTASGGQGSPDTNQGKAEPMPASAADADPAAELAAPALGSMNVGGADPQSPSHAAARPRDVPVGRPAPAPRHPGVAPADDRPAIDLDSTTKLPEGPERPDQVSAGTGQRQPGSLGVSPEEQETDVDAGAARMVPGGAPPHAEPGNAQEVPVPHEVPAAGTSQTQGIVQGARSALPPEE